MDTVANNTKFSNVMKTILSELKRFIKNPTLLYTLRRILSALFTLMLILSVVTAMIRLIPDSKLYSTPTYNKIAGSGPNGYIAAENYKNVQLFKYGRTDLEGNRVSVFVNIGTYLYNLLPIPKKVPITWSSDYSTVIKYWTGYIYLGKAMSQNHDYITNILADRIGISFKISMLSVLFSYAIGYPLGIAMARKPGGFVDRLGTIFIVLNYAIPALVFYLLMNKILGNPDGIFGRFQFNYLYNANQPQTLFPPIFSLVFLSIPGISIWVRRFMVDQLTSDYVKFARSKGLTEGRIMYVHVLRNALVPLIRNFPAVFIFAIIGSYYVEVIWNIPGTGRLLITALQNTNPDVPLIQGLTVIYAALSMAAFLLGDIVTIWFDPRIKLTHKGEV